MSIRIGILGYGNLGKGVEYAIGQNSDMELKYVFTRRNPETLSIFTKTALVKHIDSILDYKDEIDVLILCGGSATDLPMQTPEYAKYFNVVDSFDTHAKIPEHFKNTDKSSKEAGKISIISVGWDPGMFSLNRLYASAILPSGKDYTFWGKGVSQGHSDAIRRIDGVIDAKQYTIPIDSAIEEVKKGTYPSLSTGEKHYRECFVVVKEDADKEKIEAEIKNMPNYFADYNTIVHFVTQEVLDKEHGGIPHGGRVIRTGTTGADNENTHTIEYSLKLDSNPEFTASVIVSYARAAYRLYKNNETGCRTVFDIAPKLLSQKPYEELIKEML